MKTYKATVRVPSPSGSGTVVVWAQINAQSPIAAKIMLEGQYGRGNVVSVPVVAS